jgi:hypothetical protein
MALEVIGPGFGRTGTNSLRLALERLGLGPCHHMHELSLHPAQVPRWVAAARGEPVDWEAVFAGYRAQVDWPGARYWRTLAEVFPDARVVLSVRPSDAWYRSFAGTIAPELHAPPSTPEPLAADRRRMQRETIAEQVFGGRLSDRAHAPAEPALSLPRRAGAAGAIPPHQQRRRVPRRHLDPQGPVAGPGRMTRSVNDPASDCGAA